MTRCFFVSDLHGETDRYEKLFAALEEEQPEILFLGGDLLPGGLMLGATPNSGHVDFLNEYLARRLIRLREGNPKKYPRIFVILGNDDPRFEEAAVLDIAARGLWAYAHRRRVDIGDLWVMGYSFIPPSPFALKDWERYDVSRYVDPGAVSPEAGRRTIPVSDHEARYRTIAQDLDELTTARNVNQAVFLFHVPPYQSLLDRAALDGKTVEHVPLDVHIGSIAVARMIDEKQPHLTLHGHVHESPRLTGYWRERRGRTLMLSAAHDGPELALVRFTLEAPADASRELV